MFRNLTDSLTMEFKRMPEYLGDFGSRLAEWKKAREWPSQLMAHALEQADSAVWLIAGTRHSEALATLQGAIELLLKAQLHSVHPLLIAASFDYKPFRGMPLQKLRCHPQLPLTQSEEFDIDRTITCNEARIRVEALYPDLKSWEGRLLELQNLRNQLIHYGSKRAEEDRYVRLICVSAFPFLEMFLALSSQIDLGKVLGEPIFRGLRVARRVCEAVEQSGRTEYRHALKTVAAAILYRDIEFPAATDREGWVIEDDDREYHVGESLKRYVESQWKTDPVEVSCKILWLGKCVRGGLRV
jgi:hypothetical protein